jgi:hypothetical protein
MGIAEKLACFVANVVTALIMIVATSLYFTGVPLLRDIPLIGHVPLIGWIAQGEIGRRTETAYSEGQLAERILWQEQRDKDIAAAESERRTKQNQIDALTASHAKDMADLRATNAQLISEAEQKAAEDEKAVGSACNCPPAVSRRVRDTLESIGHR